MNALLNILENKRRRVEFAKTQLPFGQMRTQAIDARAARSNHAFRAALSNRERINIIAEFKRRSPSKGLIRATANPRNIAQTYQNGGAAAISVLTEEDYFDGSLDDLRTVKAAVNLPVLRKDFIVDDYQIYETAANGADALLLIVGALNDEDLGRFRETAESELGIDALVEVHSPSELQRASKCGATLIGVNNRDLTTFEVSLDTSLELASLAPTNALLVSESGLNNSEDLERLRCVGYQAFLIGESLMRAPEPDKVLHSLLKQR